MSRSTELFIGMRNLFRLYDKLLKKVCMEHDLTVIEADIISFLENNPEKIRRLTSWNCVCCQRERSPKGWNP